MSTCTVSGTLKDVTETAISGAVIKANIVTPFFSSTTMIVPKEVSTTSATDGTWSLALNQGAQCVVEIDYPPNGTDSRRVSRYSITVPASGSANFSSLVTEF